jgi:phospholipid/cholesterol/gamma-HCH transport system substrate-binding protein
MKSFLKSEVKIGLIVLSAVAVLIWGLNYLKGSNLFNPTNHYYVEYTNINGLVKSSPVNLDGYQVGLVRDIQYQYNNPGHILVDLDLDNKLVIPKGTKAVIESALIGNPSVVLQFNSASSEYLKSGDTLFAEVAPSMLDQLNNGVLADIQHMVRRTDSLLTSVETLINNGELSSSLSSIAKTSKELSSMSVKLNKSMDKLPGILDNVETMTKTFTQAGDKINQLDIASINKTLKHFEEVSSRLTSPENSLGLLLSDKQLYQNLTTTTSNANALLLDLKASPKRYVHFSLFGSKQNQ